MIKKGEGFMEDKILKRLDEIEKKVIAARQEASNKGHTFIIMALIVLLMRGCY
jgi:2-methylisocitrate lyase-like PEP mutase family enzyme